MCWYSDNTMGCIFATKIQISKPPPESPIENNSMEFNNSHLTYELDFLGKKVSKNVLIYYLKLLKHDSVYPQNEI